jgi:hypothetical protein
MLQILQKRAVERVRVVAERARGEILDTDEVDLGVGDFHCVRLVQRAFKIAEHEQSLQVRSITHVASVNRCLPATKRSLAIYSFHTLPGCGGGESCIEQFAGHDDVQSDSRCDQSAICFEECQLRQVGA